MTTQDHTGIEARDGAVPFGDLPFWLRQVCRIASRIACGRLDIRVPDGRTFRFAAERPGRRAALTIHDGAFARRVLLRGDFGFAESYLRGEWDSPDLTQLLLLILENDQVSRTMVPERRWVTWLQRGREILNRNTRAGARRNIRAHYDLGNSFYEAWLDPSMTYSSAIFAPGNDDLAAAQASKYRRLARMTGIGPGDQVLEIGFGWGGFAEFAAREIGCRITGLTLSREQHAYATRRIAEAGLADRVELKLQDYRDERNSYDRIVSIEMFEAVGEAFWDVFFQQMHDRLRPGGRAGLQVITIRDDQFERYRRGTDFIRRYVFPGGLLPPHGAMSRLGVAHDLPLIHDDGFAPDYARTLAVWRDRFQASWPAVARLGFDERFRRLWTYYLSYCEAGFLNRNIDVRQMVFIRPS